MTSTMFILKSLKALPTKGLAIFCGLVVDESNSKGKTTKISYSFEPLQPITHFMYLCDNKFHPQDLIKNMTTSEITYGFLICNGDGSCFATLSGSQKKILMQMRDPSLPKKHNKGGQSAPRFGRIREEMIHVYIKKVGEMATKMFIQNDKPIITGLIMGGSGLIKSRLIQSGWLDPRLVKMILTSVDTAYGGELGFNQAIESSSDLLSNVEAEHERKSILDFMKEIEMNSGEFVYGVDETMACLEMRIVKKLIVWEGLEIDRIGTEEGSICVKKDAKIDEKVFERVSLLDFLIENQKSFGCKIQIITKSCSEGKQFIEGFGGIGGILSCEYQMNDLKDDYETRGGIEDDINENDQISGYFTDLSEYF